MRKMCLFAEHNGVAYVKVSHCGISPFCIAYDAMEISKFSGGRATYLKLDDAIAWHEKEVADTGGRWRDDYLKALRYAKQKIAEQNVTDLHEAMASRDDEDLADEQRGPNV